MNVDAYFRALTSVEGLALATLAVLTILMLPVLPGLRWWILSVALWTASLGYYVPNWIKNAPPNVLAFPLGEIRDYGRPITILLLGIIAAQAAFTNRGWRRRLFSPAAAAFLSFQLLLATRLMLGGHAMRGAASLVSFVLIFIVFGIAIPRYLQSTSDVRKLVGSVCGGAALFAAGTLYQLAVDSSQALASGRLIGTTANPQHAALLLAFAIIASTVLVIDPARSWAQRLPIIGLTAVLAVLLMWTGSRTGFATTLIGVAVLFRHRLDKAVTVGFLLLVGVLLVTQLFPDSLISGGRFFSTQNTRHESWTVLWKAFASSPIFGNVTNINIVGESTYLGVAALTGLCGMVPFAAFLGLLGKELLVLRRLSAQRSELRPLIDLVTACVLAMLAAGFFEGLLLGTLTFPIFVLAIVMSISAFLIDFATATSRATTGVRDRRIAALAYS